MKLEIRVLDRDGKKRAGAKGDGRAEICFEETYNAGDCIVVDSGVYPAALALRFDPAIGEALVWLTASRLEFPVPRGEPGEPYPPGAFGPGKKRLAVSLADEKIWKGYRNLSVNPLDRRGASTYYPHCTATVETRDESVFAARNTIDGVVEPFCHGAWPHQSWGDAEDPHAEIMIEFGRPVLVDKAVINLRADFPHDNYWKRARLVFSDGGSIDLDLVKTGGDQEFLFPERKIEWVKLKELTKDSADPSPFPALTQWAIYGYDTGNRGKTL
jgi:hypothetical protein